MKEEKKSCRVLRRKKKSRERTGRDEVVVWGSDGGRKGKEGRRRRRRREWQEQQQQQRLVLLPSPADSRLTSAARWVNEWIYKWVSAWVLCFYFDLYSFYFQLASKVSGCLTPDGQIKKSARCCKDKSIISHQSKCVWQALSRSIIHAWDFFSFCFSGTLFICFCVCWLNLEAAWVEVSFFSFFFRLFAGSQSFRRRRAG